MFLHRRNKRYWLGWYKDGKRYNRSLQKFLDLQFPVRDKVTAQQLLASIQLREAKEAMGIPVDSLISLDNFYLEYQRFCDRNKTRRTVRSDNYRLKRWIEFLKKEGIKSPGKITKSVLNKFIGEFRDYSNSTINRYVSLIRASIHWGVRQGHLRDNLLKDFSRLKESHPPRLASFKESDLKNLFSIPDQHFVIYLKLIYYTLMRRSEALNLTWRDVRLDRRTITIRETKTKIPRTIPICKELVPILRSLSKRNGKLFPWKEDSITHKFARLREKFNLSIQGIHDFRHLRASELLSNGANPRAVQELLGHKTSKMTMEVYAHVNIEGLRQAVEL